MLVCVLSFLIVSNDWQIVTFIIGVFTGFLGISLCFLSLYHIYLISFNMTTREQMAGGKNAWNRGCILNWLEFFHLIRPIDVQVRDTIEGP